MKHIHTFESFVNEGAPTNTVEGIIATIKDGLGWATPDYVLQTPLNRAGRMALAIKLAEMGILFNDDDLGDDYNVNPLKDKKIKPMSVADAKKTIL